MGRCVDCGVSLNSYSDGLCYPCAATRQQGKQLQQMNQIADAVADLDARDTRPLMHNDAQGEEWTTNTGYPWCANLVVIALCIIGVIMLILGTNLQCLLGPQKITMGLVVSIISVVISSVILLLNMWYWLRNYLSGGVLSIEEERTCSSCSYEYQEREGTGCFGCCKTVRRVRRKTFCEPCRAGFCFLVIVVVFIFGLMVMPWFPYHTHDLQYYLPTGPNCTTVAFGAL